MGKSKKETSDDAPAIDGPVADTPPLMATAPKKKSGSTNVVKVVLKRPYILKDVPQQQGYELAKVALEKEVTLNYMVDAITMKLARCEGDKVSLIKAAKVGEIEASAGYLLAVVASDLVTPEELAKLVRASAAGPYKAK